MAEKQDSFRIKLKQNPHFILFLLMIVYTFNFLDRQLLAILTTPIRDELNLSDTELGLLGGLAFAFLYSVLAVPIARLADRYDRRLIIGTALTVWSGFTALCGAATGFWHFFAARVGVGIGEAGGVAPSHSIIADIFPPEKRGTAMAIFSIGAPIGSALGLLAGSYLAVEYGWRATFAIIGCAGLVLAPVFMFLVEDPKRVGIGTNDKASDAPSTLSLFGVFHIMRKQPSFWFISIGTGLGTMLATGFQFWLPAFLQRSHGMSLTQTAQLLSVFAIICGASGLFLGGFLADKLSRKRVSSYAFVPAISFIISLPFMVSAVWVQSVTVAAILLVIPQILSLVYIGPSVAAIQLIAPPQAKATASAMFLLIANFIGIGLGSLVMGGLSDLLSDRFEGDGLRYAILGSAIMLYPLATVAYSLASRSLLQDTTMQPASKIPSTAP